MKRSTERPRSARLQHVAAIVGIGLLAVLGLLQVAYRVRFTSSATSPVASVGLIRTPLSHSLAKEDIVTDSPLGDKSSESRKRGKAKDRAAKKAERKAKRQAEKKQHRKDQRKAERASEIALEKLNHSGFQVGKYHELVDCNGHHFSAGACATHSYFPTLKHQAMGCEVYLNDGLCDVGQYATDSGMSSPNLNCSKFQYDAGACVNVASDRQRLQVRGAYSI